MKFCPYLYGRPFRAVTDHLFWPANLSNSSGGLHVGAFNCKNLSPQFTNHEKKHNSADCLPKRLFRTTELSSKTILFFLALSPWPISFYNKETTVNCSRSLSILKKVPSFHPKSSHVDCRHSVYETALCTRTTLAQQKLPIYSSYPRPFTTKPCRRIMMVFLLVTSVFPER